MWSTDLSLCSGYSDSWHELHPNICKIYNRFCPVRRCGLKLILYCQTPLILFKILWLSTHAWNTEKDNGSYLLKSSIRFFSRMSVTWQFLAKYSQKTASMISHRHAPERRESWPSVWSSSKGWKWEKTHIYHSEKQCLNTTDVLRFISLQLAFTLEYGVQRRSDPH